ncbi:MAG: type III-B CRISPR module RAMP protein Cmr4 [Bacteroidota bacterium]
MKKQSRLILIRPFTNMHVGSGKSNSGKVDNLIQRDVLTLHPVIHSTSLKGAFRELLVNYLSIETIDKIFGKGNEKKNGKESNSDNPNSPGQCDFFNAYLLTFPMRSDSFSYFQATSPGIIKNFLDKIQIMDVTIPNNLNIVLEKLKEIVFTKKSPIVFNADFVGAKIEIHTTIATLCQVDQLSIEEQKLITDFLGINLVIFNDQELTDFLVKKLPVIARNFLDNGQSKNLWYEEIVPRESLFYSIVTSPLDFDKFYDAFEGIKQMQIGGNSSVGYGYCKIKIQNSEPWKA